MISHAGKQLLIVGDTSSYISHAQVNAVVVSLCRKALRFGISAPQSSQPRAMSDDSGITDDTES